MSTSTVTIADFFTEDEYTPFGLMKVVNKVLAEVGIDKELPGPMFYTYTAKGYIETVDGNKGKGRKVAKDKAIEWTEGYVRKQLA